MAITQIPRLPTQQRFTSGSGTYTTPANCKFLRVRMVGGGGGGGGSGTSNTSNSVGTSTSFGTSLLTAGGGQAQVSTAPGAGGTITINSPAYGTGSIGGASPAGSQSPSATTFAGVTGAASPLGGAGVGVYGAAGQAAAANSGSGGGGGAPVGNAIVGGYAGAAGGYIDAIIPSPNTTYSYTVGSGGAGGTAGTSGFAGGAGGSGYIEVTEYY